MKYKAGDVVKLRDDLEDGEYYDKLGFHARMRWMKNQPIKIINIDKDGDYETEYNWYISDEMIQGLWGECKGITYEPYKEKANKYKLIEVLNKIANGELKEGTKVNLIADDYLKKLYYDGELIRFVASGNIYAFTPKDINDEDEYELIEPQEPTECEHEWKIGGIRDTIDPLEVVAFQHCEKCGMTKIMETKNQENHKEAEHFRDDTKIIEPTDNTTEKIEELKQLDMDFAEIDFSSHEEYARCAIQVLARKMTKQIDKLNEVIRKLNKEDNNE